jgi:nicotinamide-nucleotide amidase
MIVEIVAVGTELLLGQIVNTNAAAIGGRLADAGLDHYHQVVVGDNLERLADVVRTAVGRADAVIITGGIGPTQDDLTREAICDAIGVPMAFSQEYAVEMRDLWERRGREMPESNLQQAQYPQGGELIPNPKGSAPGVKVAANGTWIFAVPGVPAEMLSMVEEHILPFLKTEAGLGDDIVVSRIIRSWGESESRIGEMLADLYETSTNPTVAFLASAGEIKVRLTAKARSEAEARQLIDPVEAEVRKRMGHLVFGADAETIEQILLRELGMRGWSIGTAESATGGMIATRLTSVPGASAVFRGSVVAYDPGVKTDVLGVPAALIDEHGVVSEPIGLAMADGLRKQLGVDVAIATTGSAGPDELEQPTGSMVIAVVTPETRVARTLRLPGDRERVRLYSTTAALHQVRLAMIGVEPTGFWAGRQGS